MEKFQRQNIEAPKKYPEAGKKSPEIARSNEKNVLQRELLDWEKKLKARHTVQRKRAIEETLKPLREESKKKETEKSPKSEREKEQDNRLKEYGKILEDKEGAVNLRDYAYAEISEWQFNRERYNGKNGWLEQYDNLKDTDQTLEEFVLKKQYAELEVMREDMLEARTAKVVPEIFPELKGAGDEIKEKKAKKAEEISKNSKEYFRANRAEIETFLKLDAADSKPQRELLYQKFVTQVFGGEMKPELLKEGGLINVFFQDLLDDYASMLSQRNLVKEMNPLMVQMMSEDITEEEWNAKLQKQNQEKAKKLEEEKKEAPNIQFQPYSGGLDNLLYGGGAVNSSEKLGSDSVIRFEQVSPGRYEIIYPSPNKTGTETTELQVRTVKDPNTGEERRYYIFNDDSIDHPTQVNEKDFRAQVNARYLDHVMNDGVRQGKDYLGPSINDILHDNEMFDLAQQFYRPERNLREYVLTPKDAEVFRSLIKILTNKSNNSLTEGDYGNLRPVNNRISLLKYVLTMDNGAKAPELRRILSTSGAALSEMSLESLCKTLKVPANYGNFAKF